MTIKLNPLPKSGRTKAEEDRRKAQQQNAAAKKKKTQQKNTAKKKQTTKKDDRKTESPKALGLRLPSVWDNSLPSLSKADQKSALEQMRSRMDKAEKRTVSEKETVERRYNVSDESWQNPLIRTRVSTPDKMDLSRGNSGRTREEMERRDSQRELAQMNPNKWLKASRETVGLKEDEKAGVGLGTIRHGTLNKNAELFSENWDRIPKENQTDAAIQIIYTYGVNDQNRNMVMTAFNNASTYDQRKIMDAVVQTDGWSEVARGMRSTINNAPDAQEALMRQISEDMNVRNGNYLDTFQRAAGKAQVDQYNLQQKEDKIIADWAKENYDTAEAMKYSVMQSVSGWLANTYDAVALAHSDLLNAGQQEDITDGIGAPWRNAKNYEKFGDKVASVGTTVLHDLFRIVGLPISLLSKVTYTPEEVDEITRKLMGVTDWYHEAVRNNQVALEGSNLSETQKTIAEVTGMVIDQIPGIAMAVVGTPAAGMTTFGLQAGGKYGRSAYENGASIEDSVKFGLAAAAAEVATEKLFTGFGYFGKGAASKVLTDTTRKMLDNSAFKDSMTARILKRVVAGGGEATEEMVMELVQPYLERSTYDPTADGATLEEVLRSGGLGFVVAQILGLPANALGVVNDAASAKNEVMATFENRFKDLVSAGQLTPEEAKTKVQEVNDILSGRGSLNVNDVQSETKTDSDTKEVYTDLTKAKEALETKAKGKEVGEEVSVAVVENGVAETWKATVTENGIEKMQLGTTTEEEQQAYLNKAQKMETATNEAERTGYQLNVKEDIIKEVSALSKAFGKNIEFVATDGAVHGYVNDDGKISVNINSSESPARAVIAHEMTHLLENTASYGKLMDLVTENYGSSLDSKREEIKANYEAAGHPLKDSEVDYELMAHFVEEKLLTDKTTVQKLLQKDRSIGQKILDWINNIIQKITGTKEQRMLMDARDLWNKALTENKKAPESGAEKRYSISDKFVRNLEKWDRDGRPDKKRLFVGTASDALKSIGIGENSTSDPMIYWNTTKLRKILIDHPEINLETVKSLPNVLENPVIILENPDKINRIVMFGDVYGTNDIPVMVVLELSRKEQEDVMIENLFIVNSYTREHKEKGVVTTPENRGKDTTQTIIDNYRILYTDPNKKRTREWMADNRLQLPLGFIQYGPINKISYFEKDVNGGVSYGDKEIEKTSFQSQLEALKDQMENRRHSIGRGAYDTLKDLDADEYNPFAEQESPYRMDIEQTVQDAMDSIQALAVKKIAEQSRKEGQQEVNRWVAKQMQKEARNYTVGSVVELNGGRGTVTERTTKGRNVSYTITFDNGEVRENVKPDELSVAVTPDLHFDELPKDQQEAWQDPPEDWNMGKGIEDVASIPVKVKGFVEILYQNGITVGSKKLFKWFRDNGYLGNIKGKNWNKPTQKSIDGGIFEVREYIHTKNDGKEEKKYTPLITEKGQRYFLDLFLNRNNNEFLDPDDRYSGIVLPGNERNENKSPLEHAEMRAMLEEYGDDITDTGEDYSWAQALTGRGVTYSKDYARNFDAASKYNPNLRKHLQRIFVQPLEKGKADYAKAVRDKLETMHEEMQKFGIKKDTLESAAVQWIGEGQYQDKYGEIHKYTPEMLRQEFPDSYKKIEQASAYFRRMYDNYLNEINTAREKIYPDPLGYAQNKLAYNEFMYNQETECIEKLRVAISEIENVLSVKKDEYSQTKDEEKRVELTRAIRYNEERLTKNTNMLTGAVSRKNKYESMIKSIRSDIENGDVLRNKRILPRKDYFHHFREMTDSLGDVFRLSRNTTDIDPKMEGTSADTEPKSKFSGITLHRKNGRYTADAIGGMIDYVQAGEYMIHIDPVISEFRNHIKGMAEATKNSRNANKLIRWLVQWTNDLAGKTNPADRFLQDVIGREAVQFARKINSRAKANAVVGNLNSATAQIFNLPNLVGHVTDPKAYVEGFADLCKFIAREKSTRDIVKESGFLSERYLDDVISSFDEKKIKIPGKVAAWTLTVGDRYSSALIWFTAHHEAVNKGITNPIEYADDITRRCVAGRGIGEIPITQKSNITQIFAPFQIEVNNAWQLYKEKLGGIKTANTKRDKVLSFTQFLAILIVNFMLNTLTDLLIHRRVVFDPIYVLFQCIADWMNEDEEEETNWAERFVELMGRESGEIISNMPYGSLIAYYAFNNQWAREKIFGDQDPTRFGVGNVPLEWLVGFVDSLASGEDIVDDAVGFLTTFVLPFGGKQAERTWQGLVNTGILPQVKWGWKEGLTFGRVDAPGSYTRDGQFQFPLHTIKSDFGQWVTNVIFGKYATDEGQKYLGKDFENSSIWQNIIGFNKTKERKELSEKGTKVLTDLVKAGADVFEVYDTIRDIQDAEDAYSKRNVLLQSELSADEKASILLGYLTQKDDVESTEKKLNGILAVGLTVDDYLSLTNTKYIIDNDEAYETAQDKAWAFNNALIADGYTTEQIKGISDVMKFWSHIPADTSKFDKLTDLGLDAETTMKVTEALGALEPLPGEKSISTLQKAEAIAKLGLTAEQEVAAMGAAMDKKQYAKYTSMTEFGVTAQTWVDFENALAVADAANSDETKRNGSYDKDEKAAALATMDVSNAVKAVLWQSKDNKLGSKDKDTSWKAGRNPYDSATAAKMIDSYMAKLDKMETESSYASPLGIDIASNVTSEFGYRIHPISGKRKHHDGIDIAAKQGEPVLAAGNGEVVKVVSSNTGYGNHVIIEHEDGTQTLYAHLYSYGVKEGDTVAVGQQIGEVGSTGASTGNHLHFEVRVDGVAVDPQTVFDLTGEGIKSSGDYTPIVSGGGSSGGSSSGNGGGSSSGSRSGGGYASSNTSRVASVRTSNQGYINSSGNIVLPRAGGSSGGGSAPVTGRSTKAPTYAAKGLTLPKASDYNRGTQKNIGATSVATTQRTGRTGGSLWNPNILG